MFPLPCLSSFQSSTLFPFACYFFTERVTGLFVLRPAQWISPGARMLPPVARVTSNLRDDVARVFRTCQTMAPRRCCTEPARGGPPPPALRPPPPNPPRSLHHCATAPPKLSSARAGRAECPRAHESRHTRPTHISAWRPSPELGTNSTKPEASVVHYAKRDAVDPWSDMLDAMRSQEGATGVWRNGSASDSRSEGWEFESLCPHIFTSDC